MSETLFVRKTQNKKVADLFKIFVKLQFSPIAYVILELEFLTYVVDFLCFLCLK